MKLEPMKAPSGIMLDDPKYWWDGAACANDDGIVAHDMIVSIAPTVARVREWSAQFARVYCNGCPCAMECLREGMAVNRGRIPKEKFGVWGGVLASDLPDTLPENL